MGQGTRGQGTGKGDSGLLQVGESAFPGPRALCSLTALGPSAPLAPSPGPLKVMVPPRVPLFVCSLEHPGTPPPEESLPEREGPKEGDTAGEQSAPESPFLFSRSPRPPAAEASAARAARPPPGGGVGGKPCGLRGPVFVRPHVSPAPQAPW